MTTTNLPETVKIEGITYQVLRRPMADEGSTLFNSLVLTIAEDMPQQKCDLALLHEIIEVIDFEHELRLPHTAIMTLGATLHQVFTDNPKLLDLFKEAK